MTEFEYSIDALNIRPRFLSVDHMVYVEADDDRLFWSVVIQKFIDSKIEIEAVGCATRLDYLIEKIKAGELTAVCARDGDYIKFCDGVDPVRSVMYTFGYSIENSLLTRRTILEIISVYLKTSKGDAEECEKWIMEFSSAFKTLLAYDIENQKRGFGIRVLKDNCSQFMLGRHSHISSEEKIKNKIAEIKQYFKDACNNDVSGAIEKFDHDVMTHIRGHFLHSAIHKFVNNKIKRCRNRPLSCDGLLRLSMMSFRNEFNEGHEHYSYYERCVKNAFG